MDNVQHLVKFNLNPQLKALQQKVQLLRNCIGYQVLDIINETVLNNRSPTKNNVQFIYNNRLSAEFIAV